MTHPQGGGDETLLCDTSFVSVMQDAARRRDVIAAWPDHVTRRLNSGVLAISVITIAELRAGHAYARWGEQRRGHAEALMAAYLTVPLDVATLDRWATAWAATQHAGHPTPHNDLWIAATALTRRWPLISCDHHFDYIDGLEHIYLRPTL